MFAGCGGGSSAADSFGDLVATQRQVAQKVCSCSTDPVACESQYSLSEEDITCVEGVLADYDTDAVRAAIDCREAAASDYFACINPIACDDTTTAQEDCNAAYGVQEEACPPIPSDADTAVNAACFPE